MTMKRFLPAAPLLTAALAQALIQALLSADAAAQQRFPVATLNIGIHLIQAEVAVRDEERAQGLMFREQLGPNEGMVFRFPDAAIGSLHR